MSQELVHTGGCYCGRVGYEVKGNPVLSAYCHCSLCRRLTGCPFVHTVHFDQSNFKWTHPDGEEALDHYVVKDKAAKKRYRCKTCGACVASFHSTRLRWSVWGGQLAHDETTRKIFSWDVLKPTMHIFYDTRMLDINDSLPKWETYENSKRLDA